MGFKVVFNEPKDTFINSMNFTRHTQPCMRSQGMCSYRFTQTLPRLYANQRHEKKPPEV